MKTLTTPPLCQRNIGSSDDDSSAKTRIFAHHSADAATAADREQVELKRVFMSAGLVMTAKGLQRGERAFATRILLQVFMRQQMPSAADVEAIDRTCDRVLENMTSRLAQFVLAERKARRALIKAEENVRLAREALARSFV